MQKKIIALAVAGLMSGAAFAQSNVTIYGVADAFFGQDKASTAAGATTPIKRTVVDDGVLAGSRIGFKGTEDLGGGLKALFVMEFGVNSEEAAGLQSNARQQMVGLTGGFGTFVAGRLYSPGYNIANKFNTGVGGQRLSALAALQDEVGATINMGATGRLNNGMAYVSPSMSGLVATVAYTTMAENTRGESDRVWGLGLDYDNGPISAGFAHHNIVTNTAAVAANTTLTLSTAATLTGSTLVSTVSGTPGLNVFGNNAAAAFDTKIKENIVAGSYDFGVAKAVMTYQNQKTTAAGVESAKNNIWNMGAIVPVGGAGSFRINYARLNDKMVANNDAKSWSTGYIHSLSKRTSVYGGYSQTKSKNAAMAAVAGGLAPTNNDGKSRTYGVGLNHSF